MARQIKVNVAGINLGERAISISLNWPIDEDDGQAHVGQVWSEFSKRRLVGALLSGESEPEQTSMVERSEMRGSFDTQTPSFDDKKIKLTVTFESKEIDLNQAKEFKYSTCWLIIDSLEQIPPKVTKKAKKAKLDNEADRPLIDKNAGWQQVLLENALALTPKQMEDLAAVEVTTLGTMVELVNGVHPDHASIDDVPGFMPVGAATAELKLREHLDSKGIEAFDEEPVG